MLLTGEPEKLRDVVIGHQPDDDDPPQRGSCRSRESDEVKAMIKDKEKQPNINAAFQVPIGKHFRHMYVFVVSAPSKATSLNNLAAKYSLNAELMEELPPFKHKEDNTCDVCGAACTEALYEFRCYLRREHIKEQDKDKERCLHPFICYISKKCGTGLLGVQSDTDKLLEQLHGMVTNDYAKILELWEFASKAERKVIEEKLKFLSRTEAGESRTAAEKRNAERVFGALAQASDVFRACASALAPSVKSWDVAAVTVQKALDRDVCF
jgi:hypothetical protein